MKFDLETRVKRIALTPMVVALSLLTAPVATAATMTLTETFSGSKSNQFTQSLAPSLGTGPATASKTLGVFDLIAPQFQATRFDQSLGTLQSVQIVYQGTYSGSNRVALLSKTCSDSGFFDSSCESQTLDIDYSIDFGVFSEIGSVDEVSTTRTATFRNTNTAFLSGSRNLFAQTTLTGASDLAAYSGTGTFDLTGFFFPTLSATLTCDPDLGTILLQCSSSYRAYYDASFTVSLIYTYDDGITPPPPPPPNPVPLPAGMPLLLASIGVLGWLRRRAR